MAIVIKELIKFYKFLNEDIVDPRTQDLFLVGSIWYILAVVGFYLYFVNILGPKFMEKRQPYKLDKIIQLYDIFQIICNVYIFYLALDLGWLRDYSFTCQPVDFSNTPHLIKITRTVWKFFLLKLLDLMDTVFFILKKKQNHVTFLHVYHHAGMVLVTWGATKYMPGGHATFTGLVNTFVHMIMYTYYLLSSFKMNLSKLKKRVTQLQMAQFCLIIFHFLQLMWVEDCGFPIWPIFLMVPQNFLMLLMFWNFYYKVYIKDRSKINSTNEGIPVEIPNEKKSKEQ